MSTPKEARAAMFLKLSTCQGSFDYTVGDDQNHPGEIAAQRQGLQNGDAFTIFRFQDSCSSNVDFHFFVGPNSQVSTLSIFHNQNPSGESKMSFDDDIRTIDEMIDFIFENYETGSEYAIKPQKFH